MVKLKKIIVENKVLLTIVLSYIIVMLSIIMWGIPNTSHPFTYHMDEWHQLQSIKSLFKSGSSNVSGAANGPILHFLISGVFLLPFYIAKIIDPFIVKSVVSELEMQQRIFIILRLSTLIYGVLSIMVLYHIAKRQLQINPIIPTVLFTISPIWLSLSNYFKYDIAVTFWILVFIMFAFKYKERSSLKNFILLSFLGGVALSIKISVVPIVISLVISFFLFEKKWRYKLMNLIIGLLIFTSTFVILGIPDLPFHLNQYKDFLLSNIVTVPQSTENYKFGMTYWIYSISHTLPTTFGICALVIFLSSIIIYVLKLLKIFKKGKVSVNESFLFFSFIIFLISILPLRLYAWGNRALVFYPFIILLSGIYIHNYFDKTRKIKYIIFVFAIFSLQLVQSFPLLSYKYVSDVRVTSSNWIKKNISNGEKIGIENIPIYQEIPDFVLYEYYLSLEKENKSRYRYEVIDSNSMNLPKVVIITNRILHENYMHSSEKINLIKRLHAEGYEIKKEFIPPRELYLALKNELGFFASGLIASPTITIYER